MPAPQDATTPAAQPNPSALAQPGKDGAQSAQEAGGALGLAIEARDFDAAQKAAASATDKELEAGAKALERLAHGWRHNASKGPGEEGRKEGERRMLGLAQTFAAIARAQAAAQPDGPGVRPSARSSQQTKAQSSAQSFLFLLYLRDEFSPSANEATIAAMAAEAGGCAKPLDPQQVARIQWRQVPDKACERVATAFSRAGGFASIDGGPNRSWLAMASGFLSANKGEALLALIREAKGSEHESLMDEAEGMIALRHTQLRDSLAGDKKPNGAAWNRAMKAAVEAGMPAGAATLEQIAMIEARQINPPIKGLREERSKKNLDWAVEAFKMGPAQLSDFFCRMRRAQSGPARPGFPAHRSDFERFIAHMAAWAADRGMEPTEAAWTEAAFGEDPAFTQILLEPSRKWNPPDSALGAAARNSAPKSHEIVAALMAAREWSPKLAGEALAAAASRGALATACLPPLSEHPVSGGSREAAMLALADRGWEAAADKDGLAAKAVQEWARAGADAKGPNGDGEPLRVALKGGYWSLAEALAEAGGWGPRALQWLARPRKGDSAELAQWAARGKAIQEEAALRKTLASVGRKQAKSDKKSEKNQRAPTQEAAQSNEPQQGGTGQDSPPLPSQSSQPKSASKGGRRL